MDAGVAGVRAAGLRSVIDLRVPPRAGACRAASSSPAAELDERFTRSSGPGGQGVNTTDSRVELRFDVLRSSAFTDLQRGRLMRVLGPRLRHGGLRLVATNRRSQAQNRAEARERLADLLRAALAPPPPPRRATRPTLGSKNRRLSAKKQRGQTKARPRPRRRRRLTALPRLGRAGPAPHQAGPVPRAASHADPVSR